MKTAICIGHSRTGDNGARSVSGLSEFAFNSALGIALRDHLAHAGHKSAVVDFYQGSSYAAAMKWLASDLRRGGFDLAIELHFNAFSSPQANGHEFLHYRTSKNGRALAAALAENFQHAFPFSRPRAEGGLKPSGRADRGGLFLALTHCPAVIVEPFFGTNPEEWEYFSAKDGRPALAAALARGISAHIRKVCK